MKSGCQSGYILFDTLVGAFVLAVAVLVGTQGIARGQRAADYAWYGQQALVIAEDMATRIRVNSNAETSWGAGYIGRQQWSVSGRPCELCSASAQIARDGYAIAEIIDRTLPQGGAQVQRCSAALCIVVWWNDDQPSGSDCSQHCVTVVFVP